MSVFQLVDTSTLNFKMQLDKIQSYYHWKVNLFLLLGLFVLTTSSNEIQACPPSKEKIEITVSADHSHDLYELVNSMPLGGQEVQFFNEVFTHFWSIIHNGRSELSVKLCTTTFEENKADRMRTFFNHYFFESFPEALLPSIFR